MIGSRDDLVYGTRNGALKVLFKVTEMPNGGTEKICKSKLERRMKVEEKV